MLSLAGPASASEPGVFAWGGGELGELGDGNTASPQEVVSVRGLPGAVALTAGDEDAFALSPKGTVMSWGENGFGQLGNGTKGGISDVPVAVSGLSEVTAIAAGAFHCLALLRNGTVEAWGYNSFGQLGNGTTTKYSDVPTVVSGLSEVTAIAAGQNDSFALRRDGTVVSWGENTEGTLGQGTTDASINPTPGPVSGLSEVIAISPEAALLRNGTVMDWGPGVDGTLGDGSFASSGVPVAVLGLTGAKALPTSGHGMAILNNGTVVDWGINGLGKLGNGTRGGISDVPVAVSGLSEVTAIADSTNDRLALLSNGTVMAWGNYLPGPVPSSDVPVQLPGLSGITSIATGQGNGYAATQVVPTKVHWYRVSRRVEEGRRLPYFSWGRLALTNSKGGAATECQTVVGGYVENTAESTPVMLDSEGVEATEAFDLYDCVNAECEAAGGHPAVSAEHLPWPGALSEEAKGIVRLTSIGAGLFLHCQLESLPPIESPGGGAYAGLEERTETEFNAPGATVCTTGPGTSLQPRVVNGTSTEKPSKTEFSAAGGGLECGSDGTLAVTGNLKLTGYEESELLSVKRP